MAAGFGERAHTRAANPPQAVRKNSVGILVAYPGAALALAGSGARQSAYEKAAFADYQQGKRNGQHGRCSRPLGKACQI